MFGKFLKSIGLDNILKQTDNEEVKEEVDEDFPNDRHHR